MKISKKKDLIITKEIFDLNNMVYDKNKKSFERNKYIQKIKDQKNLQKEYLKISEG